MKRREFLKTTIAPNTITKANNLLFNETLENNAPIDKFEGEWDINTATHLLRRALFGFKEEDIQHALSLGLDACVDELLNDDEDMPDPPIKFFEENYDDGLEVGDTFVDKPLNFRYEAIRARTVQAWFWGNCLEQGFSLREKMSLFWTNHFSTQVSVVNIGKFQYDTNNLIRKNSLGNFKKLVREITVDPTMMMFLNGYENIVGSPNENYARELFELFTIGKGQQKGEGDYTTFTEQDVIEAAKVLTGFNFYDFRNGTYQIVFYPNLHDFSDKRFSYAFGNKTIKGQGDGEIDELIDMIFSQEEVARFIVRKLYRWFVFYRITDHVEETIIEPLAQILRENDYNIKPVLKKLFTSQHFYDESVRGAMIKNPADFLVGLTKSFRINIPSFNIPDIEDIYEHYYAWYFHYYVVGEEQEMNFLEPPSVAGWEAYYQFPNYYRKWISSTTYPLRVKFTHRIFSDRGLIRTVLLKAWGVDFANSLDDASDPDELIEELVKRLYPFDLSQDQKLYLRKYLVNEGQPDYVWNEAWNLYKSEPENLIYLRGVEVKLAQLLAAACDLAEYQLM